MAKANPMRVAAVRADVDNARFWALVIAARVIGENRLRQVIHRLCVPHQSNSYCHFGLNRLSSLHMPVDFESSSLTPLPNPLL
jgi:hypothetical protein